MGDIGHFEFNLAGNFYVRDVSTVSLFHKLNCGMKLKLIQCTENEPFLNVILGMG